MTDSKAPNDRRGEMHTGYSLESGLLTRIREWADLLPWLRLARTLRAAGSPVMVGSVALTFILWWNVQNWMTGTAAPAPVTAAPVFAYEVPPAVVGSIGTLLAQMNPMSVFNRRQDFHWRTELLTIGWALLAWLPVSLYLLRQGALLTAGRDLVPLASGLRQSIRLTPIAWLIALVPLACVLFFAAMVYGAGWAARLIEGIGVLEAPLAVLVVLIAIPCGLLGFGAYVAVPLGWAALANERDPDALDSLSRGYEYLYRRPLQVVLYAALSFVVLVIITALATAITQVAAWVVVSTLELAGTSELFVSRVITVLVYYPVVVAITLCWALVGGVYLLLRYDAGEQEVEDLWQPAPKPKPPLPVLPSSVGTDR